METERPPDWVISPTSVYPLDQYLTGIGEGTSREQAEKRAYAAVARIFVAEVQAHSHDRETYDVQESGYSRQTQRTLHLDQRTQVRTEKVLENVKILDTWYQTSKQKFFSVAGLNRRQAEQIILVRLTDWDLAIQNMLVQGRTHSQKIQRIHGYKRAMSLLQDREQLNADLMVIRPDGKPQLSPYSLPTVQREFQEFVAHEVLISVAIGGENAEETERAIIGRLKKAGLSGFGVSPQDSPVDRAEDVAIIGHVQLWTIDLPDPLFTYVRWCGDIDIYEFPSRQLIGVISKTGREGHITEPEARVRAAGAMQEVLGSAVARVLTQSVFAEKNPRAKNQTTSKACPH